jgi:hypothetical protein
MRLLRKWSLIALFVVVSLARLLAAGETEWCTLRGRFLYDGSRPIEAPAREFRGEKFPDESLLVSEAGGIANIYVYLASKGVPIPPEAEANVEKEVVTHFKDHRFAPRCYFVWAGKQVLLSPPMDELSDSHVFSPSLLGGKVRISPRLLGGGEQYEMVLLDERSLSQPSRIYCNIHAPETGWVLVRDNPFAAISDQDGKFEIKFLPRDRELKFVVWHEKQGILKTANWPKGRMVLTLPRDSAEHNLGDVKLAPQLFEADESAKSQDEESSR